MPDVPRKVLYDLRFGSLNNHVLFDTDTLEQASKAIKSSKADQVHNKLLTDAVSKPKFGKQYNSSNKDKTNTLLDVP